MRIIDSDSRRQVNPRRRAMGWTLMFILASAMILPTASYLVADFGAAQAQVSDDGANQRANFWRAVRGGNEGYSAVSGPETNVLINNGGQNWRQVRNGLVANYGGWLLFAMVIVILLFFALRGPQELEVKPSGKTVPRWNVGERILHWYTAIGFVILAITGLSMLFGRAVLIPLFGLSGFANWASLSISVHNTLGPFFSIGVLLMFVFWVKNNIPKAVDLKWFAAGGGFVRGKHPSAGKANAGEKVWFWIVSIVGLVFVCVSGIALIGWLADLGLWGDSRANMQLAHTVHSIAAIVWMTVFMGHAYIGTIGQQGALEGMTTGRVGVEWAEQHHDLWFEQIKNETESTAAARTGDAGASPEAEHAS